MRLYLSEILNAWRAIVILSLHWYSVNRLQDMRPHSGRVLRNFGRRPRAVG